MNPLPATQLDTLTVVDRGVASPNPHYISGEWLHANWEDPIDVVNPATEEAIGAVYAGTPEDIDRAVNAARGAFPEWSALPLDERVALLERVGATITVRREELALLITKELGMPIRFTRQVQVDSSARAFSRIGAYAEQIS